MKNLKAAFRHLFKKASAEKAFQSYSKEVREAVDRKNEIMYWLFDIARYGPFIK